MENNKTNSPFSQLVGQERARTILARSLSSGRIAHAYLFKGPDGVGKKLFATAMAKALNCTEVGPKSSCGGCLSCKKIVSTSHPDFCVVGSDKRIIKIDKIREICRSFSYPPYESRKRVVVLEDVHNMRHEAANSLLKTLEEPPENNILILTAEASKSVLTTISSRCQIIPFFSLTEEETVTILTGEDHLMKKEHATLLARLSEGSPGRALLLEKNEMVDTWHHVIDILSDPQYKEDQHTGLIMQLAGQMAALKENLLPILGLLRIWLRDLLMEISVERKLHEKEVQNNGPKGLTVEKIFAGFAAIDQAEQQLGRNCNRALVCEILLFRLQ